MAFTDTEKFRIVRLLGWNAGVIISGNTSYSKIISDRLTGLPSAVETEARDILARLIDLEEKREEALSRASTKQVDDIILNTDELNILAKERGRWVRELSDMLDIPVTGSANRGINIGVCV